MTRYSRFLGMSTLALALGTTLSGAAPEDQGQGKVPERSQIDPKYTWDLTALYPNPAAWEAVYRECESGLGAVAKMKGTVAKSPEALLAYLWT